ncbi:MAG TPA: peptide deformylase [Rickettsiales bacterium]|nr:peptide deformylase [Rickettsiales bacterium]
MAVLPIIVAPDPTLKQKSARVEVVDDTVRATLNDMLDTMYRAGGIGLAGVQVGVLKKLIVIDVNWRDDDAASRKPLKLINAEITADSDEETTYNEGCLSFPDQYSEVVRPKEITVAYLDENGNPQELKTDGLLATCIQHEIDHTNGITFVDHISRLKRDMIIKKLEKAKRNGVFDHHHHHHEHNEFCNHE